MHRLMQFGETVVTSSVRDSYYQMEQNFPDDIKDLYFDQFEIAFAITAYDGNPEPIDDEKYGKIYSRYDQWGYEGERNTYLETHQCTDEELGFAGDPNKSRFFPVHPNSYKDFEFRKKKFQCFDQKLKLSGDYNSEKTRRI